MAIRLFQSPVEWNTQICRWWCRGIVSDSYPESRCMFNFFAAEVLWMVTVAGIPAIRSAYTCLQSRKISLLKSHTEALIKAATLGDTKEVKRMILLGANVNARDSEGYTPLMLASRKGFLEVMLALLKAGANIEESYLKKPALIEAAQFGHVEAVRLLLAAGANVNISFCNTALMYAVIYRKIEVARALLQAGADVDLEGTIGGSPLSYACTISGIAMVETFLNEAKVINPRKIIGLLNLVSDTEIKRLLKDYLYKKGIRVDSVGGSSSDTGTEVKRELEESMRQFYGRSSPAAAPNRTSIPYTLEKFDENTEKFFAAAYRGDINELRARLDAGVNVNTFNHNHATALMEASCHGHLAAVLLLIGKGADVNACNRFGETALSLAASMGHETIVQILMINGADLEKKDLDEKTPLFLAMEKEHMEVMRRLLKGGASFTPETLIKISKLGRPNAVGVLLDMLLETVYSKVTKQEALNAALLGVSEKGLVEMVELLLDRGADMNARDIFGNTSFMLCVKEGHFKGVQELSRRGADYRLKNKDGKSAYEMAKARGSSEVREHLRSLRELDEDALMKAAKLGDTQKLHELVEKGVDIKCEICQPGPLRVACEQGHLEFVKALFSLGAEVHPVVPPSYGRRYYDREIHIASYRGHTEIIRLLVSKGVDVNAKGEDESTPLIYASRGRDNLATVELLIGLGARINDLNSDGWNALMYASRNGHLRIGQALLAAGADVWASNGKIFENVFGNDELRDLIYKKSREKQSWPRLLLEAIKR